MTFDCTIELKGLTEAWNGALAHALAELRARLKEQFATQGAAYGKPWLPRKRGRPELQDSPLLFRTGRLYRSWTELDEEHVEEISPGGDSVLFGSRVPYAGVHEWGTIHTPARRLLTAEILRAL